MKKDKIQEGKILEHSAELGTPSQDTVEARAREIALINGRSSDNVLESDLEEARAELTGEVASANDELVEGKQWQLPGTAGGEAQKVAAADEQTNMEKFVQQGVDEAEHDSMVEHTRDSLNQDKDIEG